MEYVSGNIFIREMAFQKAGETLGPDPGERREHQFPRVAPHLDAAFNRPELQRANVTLVFVAPGFLDVERIGFPNSIPDWPRPFDPFFIGYPTADWRLGLSGLAEDNDVVGQPRP
jgi:hypothetical protein